MVEHLKSCCCCCSLVTGSILIGVMNTLSALVAMGILINISSQMEYEDDYLKVYMIVAACICVIDVIIGILLVIGSVAKIPALVKTWVVYHLVGLVLGVFGWIFLLSKTKASNTNNFVSFPVGLAMNIYYIMVVNSYHTKLTKRPTEDNHPHANYEQAQANVV